MPGLIVTFFARFVGQRFAKAAAIVSAIAITVALLWIGKALYDRSVVNSYKAEIQRKAEPATQQADEQRAVDHRTNAKNEQELHNAINAAPGGALSPAAHALACERLRKAGRNPAACRPAGGDGAQARPD